MQAALSKVASPTLATKPFLATQHGSTSRSQARLLVGSHSAKVPQWPRNEASLWGYLPPVPRSNCGEPGSPTSSSPLVAVAIAQKGRDAILAAKSAAE